MPRPITTQAARYAGALGASERPARPAASSAELALRTGRPPWRSIARPTRGEIVPAARSPSETPPTTRESGQPVSAAIGFASTASR
jgi:hypothetical protein